MEKALANISYMIIGFVICLILLIGFTKEQPKLDLPEEYSQATSTDTLIAIKQGKTLHVQFNNK